MGTFLDVFVWYYSKELKIYDEDFEEKTNNAKNDESIKNDNKESPENNIELPLISVPSIEEK